MAEVAVTERYVEERDGGYWIAGTRVSLDSIVYGYHRGASPESIQRSFPLLRLEQIYGAIAFYLGHRPTIDAYLELGEAQLEQLRQEARRNSPDLYGKLDAARNHLPTTEP